LKSSTIESVEIDQRTTEAARKRNSGCIVSYRTRKAAKYDFLNNSSKKVEKLYIDHTADPSNNGYFITTKENCIKSVTGNK
jgi:hypothetical protein